MKTTRSILVGAAALLAAGAASARPLEVRWWTIDGGGGNLMGPTLAVASTVGQHDAGVLTGGTYTLTGGFWAVLDVTCYPDCNGSGTITIADFACFQARFAGADPYADCNGSGTLTIADFACFQSQFAGGCP